MSFSPLVFDPTKVDIYLPNDTNSPRGIRNHIQSGDSITETHQKRNFRFFLTSGEMKHLQESQPLNSEQVYMLSVQLMERAVMMIEGSDSETAKQLVKLVIKEPTATAIIDQIAKQLVNSCDKKDNLKWLMTAASDLYDMIETELYVQSMKLNLEDFQSIFPVRSCVHDMAIVLKRIENPEHIYTEMERKRHFKNNRTMSFAIVACMSMFDVEANAANPAMKTLLNAGRYQSQKVAYDDAAEMPDEPTVLLKDELDGAIM